MNHVCGVRHVDPHSRTKRHRPGKKPQVTWCQQIVDQHIQAVVHTHSVYATTIACLGWELPPVHYLIGFSGKKVPIAPYATFGTKALARHVAKGISSCNAILLANHGLVTVGADMAAAFTTAEEIEFVARVYYQAKNIGQPVLLPDREMEIVIEKFKTYGQCRK